MAVNGSDVLAIFLPLLQGGSDGILFQVDLVNHIMYSRCLLEVLVVPFQVLGNVFVFNFHRLTNGRVINRDGRLLRNLDVPALLLAILGEVMIIALLSRSSCFSQSLLLVGYFLIDTM